MSMFVLCYGKHKPFLVINRWYPIITKSQPTGALENKFTTVEGEVSSIQLKIQNSDEVMEQQYRSVILLREKVARYVDTEEVIKNKKWKI